MEKNRIAVLASGSGSNAEEIFKHFANHPSIEITLLLSNNPKAYALERAKKFNIASRVFNRQEFLESNTVIDWLREEKITHIILAGFLWLIPSQLINEFHDRIVNIHPALLPLFGGKGMFGMKVHEAVKLSGVKETGITIHLVNEHYDEGRIIFQGKCSIDEGCTPEEIARRVHQLEYDNYPREIEKWILSS